jgi:hypothetical protein
MIFVNSGVGSTAERLQPFPTYHYLIYSGQSFAPLQLLTSHWTVVRSASSAAAAVWFPAGRSTADDVILSLLLLFDVHRELHVVTEVGFRFFES